MILRYQTRRCCTAARRHPAGTAPSTAPRPRARSARRGSRVPGAPRRQWCAPHPRGCTAARGRRPSTSSSRARWGAPAAAAVRRPSCASPQARGARLYRPRRRSARPGAGARPQARPATLTRRVLATAPRPQGLTAPRAARRPHLGHSALLDSTARVARASRSPAQPQRAATAQ
jgi:hypothetical protein